MTSAEKNAKWTKVLAAAKINTRRVTVIGSMVHIDTYEKYESKLLDLMSLAGLRLIRKSNGRHMDSFDGFRMVFGA